jgi:hypothetical protein
MANISNVINVALIPEGQLAARDNMNVVAILTSEQTHLSSAKRYAVYSDAASVATDFGSSSQASDFANTFFSQTPNPANAGGYLVVGYWRKEEESTPATKAVLTGASIDTQKVVSQLQAISDGSLAIEVDGTEVIVTGLDFRTSTSIGSVVGKLDQAITGATVSFSNGSVVITSDSTGETSTLGFVYAVATGTFVGNVLGLASGSGAVVVDGQDAGTLAAETKVDAVTELKSKVNFKGCVFIDQPSAVEAKALAEWSQANGVLSYDVFSSPSNLEIDPSNVVWDIKLSSLSNYRMLFSKVGNRKLAVAYMSRAHVVTFGAENSALTMHLKELRGVAAESYTQGEINAAKEVGLDVYTAIKNTPVVLTSGANDYLDNRYNLLAYIDSVQTDTFNLLKATGTKIPQTTRGVNQLVAQIEKTTRGFVRAGVFASGTWSSPDSFGDVESFNRSIELNGYYVLAGSLSDQPQSDRAARKSPVIQVAVKNAGAIHSADIIINFNL